MNARSLRIFLFSITWLLALPWNAQGRIGETLDECKVRYGNPIKEKGATALFFKNFTYVSAHFAEGSVDEISYYKKDPKYSKKSVSPSDAEVSILLRANAPDTAWEFEGAHQRDAWWINKDKGLSAFRSRYALTISVSNPAAYKGYHERKTAGKNLEGF